MYKYNQFRIYTFFVPELIEAQRSSFLKLLQTDIPSELDKHNPIELKVESKKKTKSASPVGSSQMQPTIEPSLSRDLANGPSFQKAATLGWVNTQLPAYSFDDQGIIEPVIKSNRVRKNWNNANLLKPLNNLVDVYHKSLLVPEDGLYKPDPVTPWSTWESPVQAIQKLSTNDQVLNISTQKPKLAPLTDQLPEHDFYRTRSKENELIRGRNAFSASQTIPRVASKSSQSFYIYFHSKQYKLIPPNETIKTAILKSKTYSSPIFVPADLKTSTNQVILSEWIKLGDLPLMTNRGHFIINGTARVILHQLVRSPGVYFHKAKNKNTHYADIICQRGVWLRLEIDKKGLLWLRMKNMPKIPMISFLQSFGLEHPHILAQMKSRLFFKPNRVPGGPRVSGNRGNEDKPSVFTRTVFRYSNEARLAFDLLFTNGYGKVKEKNMIPGYPHEQVDELRLGLRFIKQRLSAKSYDLGSVGRFQLNRKLGLNKPPTALTLTLDDLICIVNYLLHIQDGVFPVDDIDHLKNRRVRFSGELISNQLSTGLIALERVSAKRTRQSSEIRNVKRIHKILNTKCVNGAFKEFFNSSQLSQFMDQTNALAEITHKRRLSSLGPGGITRETAGMQIRGIHPSHYGRICPIETPEGPNAGLVNSLTTYARINANGFLETPFYKVVDGQIQNENQVVYLSADQDELKHIAPPDLRTETLACLKGNSIPVKIGSEFTKTAKSNVEFMSVSRIQMISVATSLIPFLEHDDANRALMGSNMQRQSVPVIKPERAIVGTGLEGRVVSDSGHSIQARESGLVTYASAEKIQILSFLKTKPEKVAAAFHGVSSLRETGLPKKETTSPMKNVQQDTHLSPAGSPFFATKDRLLLQTSESKKSPPEFQANIITYYLQGYTRSNQNTSLAQRPLVKEGDWVERGACLADCASSAFGELAIGKNITVAYLPWEGYNFEDAILVSERLIYDDLYTSIHIVKHKTEIRATKYGLEKITREIDNEANIEAFANLDGNGIVKIGACVSEGDILVRKVTPIGKPQLSAYQKFLYVVVDKQAPSVKDTSLRVPKGLEGRVIDIKVRTNPKGNSLEAVYIWIAEKKWLQVGDKMAGRHGNKGIVSQILPRHDMPYLPDGTPVDMVLNPLGVPSRMNVGQIFENLLGLAGKHLNQHYKILPFDEVSGPEASRSITFTKLYEARQKTGKNWLFQPANPGKVRIFDGRTGEAFDQPVTIGHPYMLKLIHLVDEKIHARATGPYSLVTQQPLRGRSKHGGQRFGEMEVWALEGFGAAYTLQEILTIKSDDIHGRQQIMNYLLKGKPLQIGRPESFRVLIRELQALCVSVEIFDYPIKDTTRHRRDPIDLDSREFNKYD